MISETFSTPAVKNLLDASQSLSVEERLQLAQAIWDTVPLTDDWRPSQEVLDELHRRLDQYDRNPDAAMTEAEAQSRIAALRDRIR